MKPWLPFEWIAAIRFLREGRVQTVFIATAVAIGVAVIVFMSAMLTSMQANFIRRVLTSQSHIQLIPPDEVSRPLRADTQTEIVLASVQHPAQRVRSIDQWQKITALLKDWPGITNVSPTLSTSALATHGNAARSISVIGIDPDAYFRIVKIPDYVVSGEPRILTDEILIGTELARDLGVSLGDKIIVSTSNGAARTLTIRAIFDLGNKAANQRSTYVSLRTAQALANLVGGVTTIDATVADVYEAETIAKAIHTATGVEADSWIATNAQFFTAINAQSLSNTVIRIFVGLSVALGIASVLIVSVIQRSKDIGILRAMGTKRGQILRVFLLQGGLLGLVGSVIGAGLGGAAVIFWHWYLRQPDGSELFPLILQPSLFIGTLVLATATGVAAAAVPAMRAARLDPVVAIRG